MVQPQAEARQRQGEPSSVRLFRPTRGDLLAALASAVLFFFAFPPYRLVGPVFVCLVPLAVAVARAADAGESAWRGARVAMWFSILGYGAALYWLVTALLIFTNLAILGYLGSLVVITITIALAGAALLAARRMTGWSMAVLLPIVWVASEMAFVHMSDLAFPWLPLGLGVTRTPVLAQVADISGVHGVSFWIAATNGLVAEMWLHRDARRENLRRGAVIVGLLLGVSAYGWWRMRTVPMRPVARVGVVQPNIAEDQKHEAETVGRTMGILARQTRELEAHGSPQLILWPETALPDYLFRHPAWSDSLHALTVATGAPLLTGFIDLVWQDSTTYQYYNAAMLVEADGHVRQPAYHKRRLVPVVERVPFLNPAWFRWAGQYFGGFGVGAGPVVYQEPFGKFGVLVCYESIFPAESRQYRNLGADFLVNITNDAWFGHSHAPYEHYSHLVLRAIENRVAVVRAANTGISGWIDPVGRIRAATPIFTPQVAVYALETSDVRTPYDALGDFVGLLSVLATLALVGRAWWTARVARRGEVA